MKTLRIILCVLLAPVIARAEPLEITINRKVAAGEQKDIAKAGLADEQKRKDSYQYEIKITNDSFQATAPLSAQYIIYVAREELGQKRGLERTDKIKGTEPVPAIQPHATVSIETKVATLREQALVGDWIYSNGGKIKAKDSVIGVWVKLYDGDKEVADFKNPSSLSQHQKWDPVKDKK